MGLGLNAYNPARIRSGSIDMLVLVTGGAGFIGSHLVERLLEQGHRVVVADNFITGLASNLDHLAGSSALRLVSQDMTQPLSPELRDLPLDRIYNLASPASPRGYGRFPIETLLVNSVGTYRALELARLSGARFLQASTSEVYGDPLVHPQVEEYWGNVNPNGPRACYDEGKRFAESIVMEYVRQHGVDARIARIFNCYGPRCHPADGRVVPSFCVQALENRPITVYGDGQQTRSFCYVSDLVSGFIALMETDGLQGEVVNLGNPAEHTILEFAEKIIELTASTGGIVYAPLPQDDPQRRKPDIDKARSLLNWRPEVALEDGLARTIAYFQDTRVITRMTAFPQEPATPAALG
jgi:nucleoside-diphosphate-sugar epimerase